MSDRYNDLNDCESCGVWVRPSHEARVSHDAFHDRIDRLAAEVRGLIADFNERVAVLLQRDREDMEASKPDPVSPFPMGAKVRPLDPDIDQTLVMTVTGWREAVMGEWVVDVDGKVNGYRPEWLELVPENPDTPPSSENPDKPLVCAVCGDPVEKWLGFGRLHHSDDTRDYDHLATLTPPEPACGMCGGVGMHKAGCALTPPEPTHTCAIGNFADCEACKATPTEPPVGAGWFADKWPGRLFQRTDYNEPAWRDGEDNYAWWPDLLPGRPAVPGGVVE